MKCELDRITVNYETYGEGQPILMIHGWPVDHQLLLQTCSSLSLTERMDGNESI